MVTQGFAVPSDDRLFASTQYCVEYVDTDYLLTPIFSNINDLHLLIAGQISAITPNLATSRNSLPHTAHVSSGTAAP
jgi:hypothetical protein